MLLGHDFLGMAHPLFPFKNFLKELHPSTPIGFFWSHFGDSRKKFKVAIDMGFYNFRPQMYWADNHSIVPMKVLEKSLNELAKVTQGWPLNLYVSPSCEHNERNVAEVRKRLELVKQIVPRAVAVNNPWKGHGAVVPGYPTEYHGGAPGKCDLASTDGTNIYDIDVEKWVQTAPSPSFVWGYRYNLREIGDPGQKPPAVPNRKAAPNIKYFRSIDRLRFPKGEAPVPNFKVTSAFKAPNVFKTHAEDDQENNETTPDDPRENRPVLLYKSSANHAEILTATGKSIGKLVKFDPPLNGLTRYYSGLPGGVGLYGYEIGEKAEKQSGSEFIWLKLGGKIVGPIHPAFRAGSFRG